MVPPGPASDGEVEDYEVTLVVNSLPTAQNENYVLAQGSTLAATDPDGVLSPANQRTTESSRTIQTQMEILF